MKKPEKTQMQSRRNFLKSSSLVSAAVLAPGLVNAGANSRSRSLLVDQGIACQQYTWFNYYQREGKDWFADMDESFEAFKSTGMSGYEPSFSEAKTVATTVAQMKRHGIWADSLYVNSILHDEEQSEKSIDLAVEIVKQALPLGIKIAVTNPSPIDWNSKENKSDKQLRVQARELNRLGAALKSMDVALAYHTHDPEMRAGAREFHHMLQGTDPANVKLCLDAHWIYRGAGDSEVALFDIVKHYGDRIVELHLRQSNDGKWSEVFSAKGDIDYQHLVDLLMHRGLKPHIVLEQCVEEGTPQTISIVEAHKRSAGEVERVFEPFLTS